MVNPMINENAAKLEIANRLFFRLYQCANMLHKTGSRAVEEEGLTTQQWAVLGALSREKSQGGMSIGDLPYDVAHMLGGAMLLYGVSVVAMGLAPTYALSILVLLCFGGAYLSIASTINTTIQLVVLEELRGVVIAIYLMCLTGALPIGAGAGAAASWAEAFDAVASRARYTRRLTQACSRLMVSSSTNDSTSMVAATAVAPW